MPDIRVWKPGDASRKPGNASRVFACTIGSSMSAKSARRFRAVGRAAVESPKRRLPRRMSLLLPLASGVLLTAGGFFLCSAVRAKPSSALSAQRPRALDRLLATPPEQLAAVDIAEMNLLCATGLPGAEGLDVNAALATLDGWARRVKSETDRHLYRFRRSPGDYRNSEGYFRMLMLVTVLQQDLGVHYNLDRVRRIDFRRSQDLFLHGLIGSDNGGTCVSMPVVYTAVARRLGYPVKLVLTKGHVFCRWDAPAERFNIEATNAGMNSFPDPRPRGLHPGLESPVRVGGRRPAPSAASVNCTRYEHDRRETRICTHTRTGGTCLRLFCSSVLP